MSAHAFLAPSSAHRWVVCALAPHLEARFPETEPSPESLEGTAAHWVVEEYLNGFVRTVGELAPNGVPTTQEMIESAELVGEDIQRTLGPDWRRLLRIEQQVPIPQVHPRHNWGTPDYTARATLPDGRKCLYIWDFKFGHGIVEVVENWQLIDYAAGLLDDDVDLVEFAIIQPRAYHREGTVRRWRVFAVALEPYTLRLREAAEKATADGGLPPATLSPKGCKHCKGRHACEALQRTAYDSMSAAQQYGMLELDAQALGIELRLLTHGRALLDARISGLEAQAEALFKRGESVPFWTIERAPGRLAWTCGPEEVFSIGDDLGVNLRKPPEPVTPTQAKTAAKKAGVSEIFEVLTSEYTERKEGNAKLRPDDGAKARLIFSN